ncbi:expressed unknown protein [Seminavis robusta]|uniref:Uncharacterized protein n=1 Tax=Seminavis robusta TaxID=568900 RepID=A0A9N8ELE2_9STRA|nr:expressed unknown protein [Seminavis robusta]|eukprot:Sro1159_g247630.1 n/a (649) ;mRNA; r:24064-26111
MASAVLENVQTTLADAGNDVNVTAAFRDSLLFEYQTVTSTDNMAAIPRFGHGSDFSMLFVTDDGGQAQEDYIKGLLFVGIFVLVVFGIWSLLLIGFKLWSIWSTIPGYFGGRPFTLKAEDPTKEQLGRFATKNTRKRIVFMVAGLFVVIFSILLVTKGFQQVEETRVTADVSLDSARLLVDEASLLAVDLRDVGLSAIEVRDELLIELEKERLCPQNPNYIVEDEFASAINDNAGAAIDLLSALGEFATQDIRQMEDGLSTADSIIDQVDANVEAVAENEWVGVAFILPIVFLASLLMAGTMAAHWDVTNGCYEFALTWIVSPLFISWIVISFILCGAMALSASANADFCAGPTHRGGPDETILWSIQRAGLDNNAIEYEIARFYLLQCTNEAEVDPFLFLRRHEAELTNAKAIVEELKESIAKVDVETLSFQCGRDFEPLRSSLDTVRAILDALEQAAAKGLQLLSCERIVPIYADVVYEGTCNHSVTGLTWMFSSLLVISTMGMIMIMLRSSFKADVILADNLEPTDEDSEFHSMHRMGGKGTSSSDDYDGYDGDVNDGPDGKEQYNKSQRNSAIRYQDASDAGSVYTDGNGDLHVIEVDPQEVLRKTSSPTLYELEESSFDSRGHPKPSAPFEGRYRYDDDYLVA